MRPLMGIAACLVPCSEIIKKIYGLLRCKAPFWLPLWVKLVLYLITIPSCYNTETKPCQLDNNWCQSLSVDILWASHEQISSHVSCKDDQVYAGTIFRLKIEGNFGLDRMREMMLIESLHLADHHKTTYLVWTHKFVRRV